MLKTAFSTLFLSIVLPFHCFAYITNTFSDQVEPQQSENSFDFFNLKGNEDSNETTILDVLMCMNDAHEAQVLDPYQQIYDTLPLFLTTTFSSRLLNVIDLVQTKPISDQLSQSVVMADDIIH
jgi:hypothetical protein